MAQSFLTLFETPWTVAHQAPLWDYLSKNVGFPFPSPGDLHDPGTEPESSTAPALAGGFFPHRAT